VHSQPRRKIAIVGTGISGLAAAWLLSRRHDVTVYERAERIGGHSNTVLVPMGGRDLAVDTGFIVFNRQTYPNLVALFECLGVPTEPSDMSLSISLDDGETEYCGTGLSGLFAQPRNLCRPRFWSMLFHLARFYRNAKRDAERLGNSYMTLGEYLARGRYGAAFRDDHLLPMASAIWSAPRSDMLSFPATSFIAFHNNHGLLKLRDRPRWETVQGGSRVYVERLTKSFAERIRCNASVARVERTERGPVITEIGGAVERFDDVVLATHADQALAILADPGVRERSLLAPFRYSRNHAVLHSDESFMPKRRKAWSSWNFVGYRDPVTDGVSVTYWMNRLQKLDTDRNLFVTLNPTRPPARGTILHSEIYEHPIFDDRALSAQRQLWLMQGQRNTWFCGSYFGAGFHEDGLQAGLAVAEELGGVRRPWSVAGESGRIVRTVRRVAPDQAEYQM
jgi:predicted NAD/FAD-binding protein